MRLKDFPVLVCQSCCAGKRGGVIGLFTIVYVLLGILVYVILISFLNGEICFVVAKAVLWIICRGSPSPSVQALSLDHRNDILANMVASVCGYVGHKYWPYLDPIGAVLISIYIMINWWKTGAG